MVNNRALKTGETPWSLRDIAGKISFEKGSGHGLCAS